MKDFRPEAFYYTSENTQINLCIKGVFSSIILSQLRRPIELFTGLLFYACVVPPHETTALWCSASFPNLFRILGTIFWRRARTVLCTLRCLIVSCSDMHRDISHENGTWIKSRMHKWEDWSLTVWVKVKVLNESISQLASVNGHP